MGKPHLQALISAALVVNADNLYSFIYHISNNKAYAQHFGVDVIECWSQVYLDFFTLFDQTFDICLPDLLTCASVSAYREDFIRLQEAAKNAKPDYTILEAIIEKALLNNFTINPEDPPMQIETLESGIIALLSSPVNIFFVRVFMPCVLKYHQPPHILYRKAIGGDYEALCNLLTIDKNAINVPQIAKIWEMEARNPNSSRFHGLAKSIKKNTTANLKLKQVKYAIATLIEVLFKKTAYGISRTQIRDLFDRYAQDTKHQLIDNDLPSTEDGFSRAINRFKKSWKTALQDINESNPSP